MSVMSVMWRIDCAVVPSSTHLEIRVDDQNAIRGGLRLHDQNLKRQAVVADLDDVVLCQTREVAECLFETEPQKREEGCGESRCANVRLVVARRLTLPWDH